MEFYKKRDFGSLIGDSLNFFKIYGKNYFKNYLALNGAVVILFVIVVVIGYGDIIKQMMGGNVNGDAYLFERYFSQNSTMLMITSLGVLVLLVLLSVISYSFPVLYLKRLSETGNQHITASEMISDIKSNLMNFLKFFLGATFILLPIFVVGFLISSFLMVILIGFLLMIFLLPIMVNIVNFTLFNLYHTDDGLFRSISKGFNIQFSKGFWKYIGSTLVMYLIIQVVTSALIIIPFILLYIKIFTTAGTSADVAMNSAVTFVFAVVYIFAIFCSLILSNLIYINAGLMYYDSRYDLQREVTFSEIDSIGQYEE